MFSEKFSRVRSSKRLVSATALAAIVGGAYHFSTKTTTAPNGASTTNSAIRFGTNVLNRRKLAETAAASNSSSSTASSIVSGIMGGQNGSSPLHPPPRTASAAAQTMLTSTTRPIPCRDGTLVFPFSLPPRDALVKRLEKEVFDVLVIGGGCVGAGVAMDAALRGLKVAIVEADDFSSGTSGRSTKLIHGGVRYLENAFWKMDIGEYRLVREALEERTHMLQAAPHMARALPIMVPLESWWQIPYYWLGGKVYDFVAGSDRHVPPSSYIGKEQALYAFPMLNPAKLKGAIVYYDGQMNDTRYGLSIVLTAIQAGAAAANYCKVERLIPNESSTNLKGAQVRDLVTNKSFEIHAKSVVNCTGPFSDEIRKMAYDAIEGKQQQEEGKKKFEELIIPAGGVHVVLPDHFSPEQMGLIVPETSDGRVLFFLPWEGGTLCGTTDSKSHLTMLPRPTLEEIDFILSESSRYLNRPISRNDVRAAWSGIRPLVKDLKKSKDGSTASISREHVVEVNPGSMVTVAGGKWTTYRRMAQDALDKVLELHPKLKTKAGPCQTEGAMLIGADRAKIVCDQRFDIIQVTLREQYGFDRDVAAHLTRAYGTRSLQIAEMIIGGYYNRAPGLHPKRLVAKHPVLEAEVVFAVEQEYAQSAVDFLGRRTRLAYLDHDAALEALPHVVEIMATLLKWDKTKRSTEMKRAKEFLETFRVPDELREQDDEAKQ